jgi:hypothetical protein
MEVTLFFIAKDYRMNKLLFGSKFFSVLISTSKPKGLDSMFKPKGLESMFKPKGLNSMNLKVWIPFQGLDSMDEFK